MMARFTWVAWLVGAALALAACTGNVAPPMQPGELALPGQRTDHATVAAEGELYVFGGQAYDRAIANLSIYDPAAGTWREGPAVPRPVYDAAAVVWEGKVFLSGGIAMAPRENPIYVQKGALVIQVYDLEVQQWLDPIPMPDYRFGHAAAVVDGVLYLVGGQTLIEQGGAPVSRNPMRPLETEESVVPLGYAQTWAYDLRAGTWDRLSDMPTTRWGLRAEVVDNRILTLGGVGFGASDAVEAYDPATDTWERLAPLPAPRAYPATVPGAQGVYLLGGETGSFFPEPNATVYRYDTEARTWQQVGLLKTARTHLAAARLNGTVYAVGGYNGARLTTMEPLTGLE